ncbi:MAG: metallophosphoesterase [bacterium]
MKSKLSRRKFIKSTTAASIAGLFHIKCAPGFETAVFSFGLVADVHYADKTMRINRYYRESIAKLEQCVETFSHNRLPFAVHLGDFVDSAEDKQTELGYLATIRQTFSAFKGPKHFVMGNHDLFAFSKEEYLKNCNAPTDTGYYAFDEAGFHFVVLDANFMKSGEAYDSGNYKWTDTNINPPQIEWLAQDLRNAASKKTIVFVHQNLFGEDTPYGVKNAPAVREILEKAGNVLTVFQGHYHKGGHRKINGIHYLTHKALVDGASLENNSFSMVSIDRRNRVQVQGFGKQGTMVLG